MILHQKKKKESLITLIIFYTNRLIFIRVTESRVKKIFKCKPLTKRSQGRPKYRWKDNIKQDICQMKIKNWIACVQDRGKWKDVVEKVKTFHH